MLSGPNVARFQRGLLVKKVNADPKESTTVFDFLLKIEKANVTCAGIEVSAGPLFTQDFF